MNQEEYAADVRQLAGALKLAQATSETVDLEAIASALERADSLGMMLDPTAWRRANDSGQLEVQRELVRWARETRNTYARLRRILEPLASEACL